VIKPAAIEQPTSIRKVSALAKELQAYLAIKKTDHIPFTGNVRYL